MSASPHAKRHPRAERGGTFTAFLIAVVICGALVAALFLSEQGQSKRSGHSEPILPAAVSTPAPAPVSSAGSTSAPPVPSAPSSEPVATSAPAPQVPNTETQVPAPDIATIAQTSTWWPKTVDLTRALTIPVVVNGKTVGQAQLPAQTSVRLVRVIGQQLEVEHLNQRLTIPFTATDIIPRSTSLARASSPRATDTAPTKQTQTPSPASPAPQALVQQGKPKDAGTYRKQALEIMESIQDKFWIRESQRYAKKAGSTEPDTVWGAGVMFSTLVAAARHEPGRYEPVLKKFFDGLNGYWDTKAKIPGYEPAPTSGNGHDKYYDDNAWMVITFFEAYELTHNPRFRRRAEETLDFVLSGWDETVLERRDLVARGARKEDPGKEHLCECPLCCGLPSLREVCSATDSEATDGDGTEDCPMTVSNLQLSDSLFADSVGFTGDQNRARLTYNSALMLRAFLGLYRSTKKPEYLNEAQRIGRAANSFLSKETGAYRDPVKWAHLMVEADLELYRATHEEYLLTRARKNADFYYETWKQNPPDDLISIASISRILWLMADTESDVGRKFWETVDAGKNR